MFFNPGDQLNRYQILEPIGIGGFAEVYLALDARLQRKVAIKVNRKGAEESQWGEFADNALRNEARTLAQLSHPSILTVFDVGEDHGRSYLVMEYLENSVSIELKRTTRLPHERVSILMSKVANGVDYVHRRGFLHRDLKPANIYLDPTGEPRLAGFKFAATREELLKEEEELSKGEEEPAPGTLAYMAPEQLRDAIEEMGTHTDVWGLGVTLYQLLTGQLPFEESSFGGVLKAIFYREPKSLRQIDGSIPEELDRICLKCLTKSTEHRYATADKLAADLLWWQRANSVRSQPRVFVSHSTKDRDFVEREIIGFLEGQGIKTWYSKVSIRTAAEWERSIMAGLESCEWFLLIMSPNAASSDWVKDELHWAIDKRPQRIIPVLVEACDPRQFHIRLARLQNIDFLRDPEIARSNLVKAFKERS